MARERVLTRPLLWFLALVAGLLLRGLDDRLGPCSATEVLQALADGDLEGAQRRELLAAVEAMARVSRDRGMRLCGAMAAVALDDEAGYAARTAALGSGPMPVQADDAGPALDRASLGDPVLAALLQAMLAEASGDPSAAERYAQVEASSRLFHMPLARRLAKAGRERLKR